MTRSLPHKTSPTWPGPRVRDSSPRIVVVLALLHAAVAGWLNRTYGGDEEAIGRWLLAPAASAAAAVTLWSLLALRIDPGRPGWKRLPRHVSVDPASLPQRPLRWHWVLWFVPLTAVVSAVALSLAPSTAYDGPETGDIVVGVVITTVAQVLGGMLGLLVLFLVLVPLPLIAVGLTRMRDGREQGMPPTGPVLVSTGLMLLAVVPMATGIAVAGTRAQDGDPSTLWMVVAFASTATFLVSAVFLAGYALYVRLSDQGTPSEEELWGNVVGDPLDHPIWWRPPV